jgi:hypothetical protein
MQARAVCKSIGARYPDLKILVGRWTTRGVSAKTQQIFRSSCAEATVATLSQMRDAMLPIVQFHSAARSTTGDKCLAKASA